MTINESRIAERQKRENRNIFSRLPAVYSASRSQGQRLLQQAGGLSIVEWRTLWDLFEAGPMTIRDLAIIQRTDHSLLSRALPPMREQGLVRMRRDTRDGRQTLVSLTAKGKAAYHRAAPVMARRRAALRDVFTQTELDTFVSLLDRFEDFLMAPLDDILLEDTR